jgi:hypothetical protein
VASNGLGGVERPGWRTAEFAVEAIAFIGMLAKVADAANP